MTRKKKIEYHSYIEGSIRYMVCSICGNYERVGELATGVKCSRCINMTMMNNYMELTNQTLIICYQKSYRNHELESYNPILNFL